MRGDYTRLRMDSTDGLLAPAETLRPIEPHRDPNPWGFNFAGKAPMLEAWDSLP
jgi:hypothetical protein